MVPRTQSDSGPALGPRPTLDRGVEVCPSYSNSPPAQPLCCPGLKSPVEPQSPASVWSRVRLLSGARSRVWSIINLFKGRVIVNWHQSKRSVFCWIWGSWSSSGNRPRSSYVLEKGFFILAFYSMVVNVSNIFCTKPPVNELHLT